MKSQKPKKIKKSVEDLIIDTIIILCCVSVLFVCIYPFYYILIMSFNNGIDMMKGGIYFWPRVFTLDNYAGFFNDPSWLQALFVTVLRTVTGTLLTIVFTLIVAYGLSFKELLYRKVYMLVVIISMYFSGGLIPYYMVIKWTGLMNNFAVYIIPGMLNLFFLLVSMTFFQEIPKELRESAFLDGATDLTIFRAIILPLSLPLVATIAIFAGVNSWNSWFDSAFFVRNNALRTLGYKLMVIIASSQVSQHASSSELAQQFKSITPLSLQVTAMIITVAPIICIYPFMQKYFIKGIMIGAVKG